MGSHGVRSWLPIALPSLLILELVCGCLSAAQRSFGGEINSTTGVQTVTLEGRVRTDKGRTIPSGVMVSLETDSGERVAQQPANTEGEFTFSDLRKLTYRLTVTADGFQPYQQSLNLGYGASKYFVNVLLTPSGDAKASAAPPPAQTDQQAPKTARKEYEKGSHALESRKLPEAESHFEKAVREYPCYARAQTDLGLVLSQQREFDRSETALKKAIECDPAFTESYTVLGQLLNAEKRFRESQSILEQGVRYAPAAWQFYYQIGIACYGQQQFAKAEEEYLKAQSLNTAMPPDFHVRLADLYTKMGSYAKAYGEMQTYLRLEPNGRFADRIKSIMHQMESSGVLRRAQAANEPSTVHN